MSNTQSIFTQEEIDNFKLDVSRYNLSITQIKPVVLQHVANKNDNFNIKTYNINRTVEIIQSLTTIEALFNYIQNKLNKYEAKINERSIKSKIQEQI